MTGRVAGSTYDETYYWRTKMFRTKNQLAIAVSVTAVVVSGQAHANLVSHYTFDASTLSGGVYANEVGGAPGATVASGTSNVAGQFGEAVRFDGIDDYLNAGTGGHPGLTNIGVGTIAFWVRTDDSDPTDNGIQTITGVLNAGSTTAYLVDINVNGDNQIRAFGRGEQGLNTDYNVNADDGLSWADGGWHHIAITWDRDNNANNVVYFDGVAQNTGVAIDGGAPTATYAAYGFDLVIGARNNRGTIDTFFEGDLDDLRVYDSVLSAGEVSQLVPEPTSLSLLGIGGCLVLARRRRG